MNDAACCKFVPDAAAPVSGARMKDADAAGRDLHPTLPAPMRPPDA
jgi:hypothetical protein